MDFQHKLIKRQSIRWKWCVSYLSLNYWTLRFGIDLYSRKHSGVHANPDGFNVEMRLPVDDVFAFNDIDHRDPMGGNHDAFDEPLPHALAMWARGEALDVPINDYLDQSKPIPTVDPNFVRRELTKTKKRQWRDNHVVLWFSAEPIVLEHGILLGDGSQALELDMPVHFAHWLAEEMRLWSVDEMTKVFDVRKRFPGQSEMFTELMEVLLDAGVTLI